MMATARSNFGPAGTKLMYHCAYSPEKPVVWIAKSMRLRLFGTSGRNVLGGALSARKLLPFAFILLLPFAFILMLAFLVAMAFDSSSRTHELLNSQAFVERTNAVLHEMDGVEDGLQDA